MVKDDRLWLWTIIRKLCTVLDYRYLVRGKQGRPLLRITGKPKLLCSQFGLFDLFIKGWMPALWCGNSLLWLA